MKAGAFSVDDSNTRLATMLPMRTVRGFSTELGAWLRGRTLTEAVALAPSNRPAVGS